MYQNFSLLLFLHITNCSSLSLIFLERETLSFYFSNEFISRSVLTIYCFISLLFPFKEIKASPSKLSMDSIYP